MRTRNSYFPNNSSVTIPRRQNKRRTPNVVEPKLRTIIEVAPMADNHTMEELLQALTKGYGEAIVIPKINADHFEIKTNLLQLVQANPYHGFERENPHTHINNFKRITSTLKFRDVPNDVIKLMMFPYSLEGSARIRMNTNSKENASKMDDRIDKLADQISTLVDIFAKKVVTPAPVKAVEESCVTYGVPNQGFQSQPFQVPNNPVQQGFSNKFLSYKKANDQMNQASTSGTLLSNTIPNPKGEIKAITTRSGVAYEGPSIPTNPSPKKVVERETEEITDKEQTNFQGNLIIKSFTKGYESMEKFFQMFQDLHFDISFADDLLLMPKFASTIKSLLTNKDKLFELAKIPLNENCSAMLLKKLLEKLGDPGKFLIPCDFSRIDVCHTLADLGASINLIPLFIWKKLSLPELTPTQMTLELADRSITRPKGVAEDVFIKVGKFYFPTDFVVIDFEADLRVPLILGRSFLRTGRALIDVYGEEITLRVNDEVVTFNPNQTIRYSSTYDDLSVNRIDVLMLLERSMLKKFLVFLKILWVAIPPRLLSLFFLTLLLPSLYSREQGEAVKAKYSIEEPPELELKDLPSHLEYAYLKGVDKLPVIIAKDLKVDEKEALLKVLKSHKRAIAWKITDIKGIDPRFCTHKILMEEDYKPTVQSQRQVNPKIHEVIKKEVIKHLDAGMIYPISDSPWVSHIYCVPKKGGITVVKNENNELIPTWLVTEWSVCIDYRKLNDATCKDQFPLPFMDQMLERLVGNEFYCFLDGFFGYIQIPINPPDQEKTTFTCPYGTFAYRIMPFGLCNAPMTFQKCMMAIFHDMIEKTMKVFMDDFLVFVDSFSSCLYHLDTMLQRCEDTNLVLNWEKCHFMVKKGIVLGNKISKNRLEISRPMTHLLEKETPFVFSKDCIDAFKTLKNKLTKAPILVVPDWNLPFKLMCDASDFTIGAVLGEQKTKHFQPIHYASKTMTEAQIHYTTTEKEMLAVVYAFEKFQSYLILSKRIVYTDHSALKYLLSKQDAKPRLIRRVLLLQEFDIIVRDKKRTENLVADHLSRLENPHKDVFENKDINENFPLDTLGKISSESTPWFVDFANFHVRNFIVKGMSSQQRKKFFKDVKHYF
nr:DNA-directed DNA polymerase [Tanacetum cinerariifolium]